MANQLNLLDEIKAAKKYEYKKLSDMPSLDERKLHLIRAPFDAQVKSNRNSITKSFIVKVAVTPLLNKTFYLDEAKFNLMLVERNFFEKFQDRITNKTCYIRVVKFVKDNEEYFYQLQVVLSENVSLIDNLNFAESKLLEHSINQVLVVETHGQAEAVDTLVAAE